MTTAGARLAATAEGEVDLVPLGRLSPNPENPREIGEAELEDLAESLRLRPNWLWSKPVLAWRKDGRVLAGNQRYRGALILVARDQWPRSYWQGRQPAIPCRVLELDEAEAIALAVADNNTWGTYRDEELGRLLGRMRELGSEPLHLGFRDGEAEELMARVGALGEHEVRFVAGAGGDAGAQDEIPTLEGEPTVTRPGDLWHLGPHRLLCGDAHSEEDTRRLLDGVAPTLIVTSPPYNQRLEALPESRLDGGAGSEWVGRMALAYADSLPEPEYQAGQVRLLDLLWGFAADGASLFYNHKPRYRDGRMLHPLEWILRSRWERRQELVWDKGTAIPFEMRKFLPTDERVYWLSKGEGYWFANTPELRALGTVWSIPPLPEVRESVPFPNRLVEILLEACSREGDAVYDPHLGSGTVLAMCERMGRVGYGMEISPRYCDVSARRWEALTGRRAEREGVA